MTRILRIGKRLAPVALLAGILLVVAQAVFALPPNPSFNATVDPAVPATGCRTINFNSTATDPENDPLTIQWDFNSDGTFDADGDTVAHTFAEPGDQTVTMRASDADSFTDSPQTVNVPNTAPTAGFTASYNAVTGATDFTSTSADGDGRIASYAWAFGDGATGTGATPSHPYAGHTPQTVSLIATDNCGVASVAAIDTITPGNTPPVVPAPTASVGGVAAPTVVQPNTRVDFAVGPVTDVNGDTPTYTWNFGDGTTGTGAAPNHTYAAAVTNVNVTVAVSDGVDTTTSAPLALRVNQAPVAKFSNDPESPAVNEPVGFNALTLGAPSADPDGTIAKYEWDFGNGTWVEDTATPLHTFTAVSSNPGMHVGLRVTDNNGAVSAPVYKDIKVNKTRPTARLRYSPANPLPGQAVTLTSNSIPSASVGAPAIALTQWDFDYSPAGAFGAAANGTSVTTSFATPGAHTVAVRVVDGSSGEDIAYATIGVNARPRSSFTFRPSKPREGGEISFISTSSDPDGPIAKQEWDLDNDGRYDDGTGVVVTRKLKKGPRTVRLRVTDSKGATDTSSQQFKVAAKPLAEAPQVVKTLGYALRSWGIRVVALYATVPAHTTVKVSCTGRGCPHGTLVERSGKKSAQLRFTKFHGFLYAGAKIKVVSYRNGSIAEYFTYTVRGHYRPPLKRKRCKALSASKYGSCR